MALDVSGQAQEGWHSLRSTNIKRALGEATDHSISALRPTFFIPEDGPVNLTTPGPEHHVPLRTIFPVDKWKQLRNFGLTRFLVKQADIITNLLAAFPSTLRSVELNLLTFVEDSGSYKGLLDDMRDTLGWRERAPEDRPKVTMFVTDDGTARGSLSILTVK